MAELTEKQKRQREYNRQYKIRNKEKIKEANKKYYEAHKVLLKSDREVSPEIKARQKANYEKHKEKIIERSKEYRKTEKGIKSKTISLWKSRGVIHENFDELYDHYISTNNCEVCNYEFDENNWKCLDHDHDTGETRYVLCNSCNCFDSWKKKVSGRD